MSITKIKENHSFTVMHTNGNTEKITSTIFLRNSEDEFFYYTCYEGAEWKLTTGSTYKASHIKHKYLYCN